MYCKLITAPVIEPITLTDLKLHLRLDSETFSGNVTSYNSLTAGSHAINTDYTHVGTGIDVLGKEAIVYLRPVNNGSGGTNDTRIEESDSLSTGYTVWSGGTFTQVTESNDTTIQEIQYTGSKRYIRTTSKVLVAACEFGTDILVNESTIAEDDLLTAIIYAGIEHVENITRRKLLTQTWEYYLDEFPEDDFIKIPFGNLASVTSIIYKDSDGTETTMTVNTDYLVETNGEGIGRIVLPYGITWPTFTAWPSKPITIKFVCGWTAAASVPYVIKVALKLICADMYENREGKVLSSFNYQENKAVNALLASCKLWDEIE